MKPVEILAECLDGSPLMYACNYLWEKDRAWCEEHCKWEEATKECWRERSTSGEHDGDRVTESSDCYVAGWMEKPDIELWKDQLLGEYEWEREHGN